MIYVVTQGKYSDYHIIAATLDKTLATKIAEKFSDDDGWDDCRVEEYPDAEVMLRPLWCVYFTTSGEVYECRESTSAYDYHHTRSDVIETVYKRHYDMTVYVQADTEEAAIKIAAEKRAQYLAEKIGL